jgi:hypothetical protein
MNDDPILRHLEKVLEFDNQYIGRQEMQTDVLRWALDEKRLGRMPPELADSLIHRMADIMLRLRTERPRLYPTGPILLGGPGYSPQQPAPAEAAGYEDTPRVA